MVRSAKGTPYKNEDLGFCHSPPMSPGASDITTWGHNFWRSEMRRPVSSFLETQILQVPRAWLETQLLRASLHLHQLSESHSSVHITDTDPGQTLPWDAQATAVRLMTINYSELPRRSSQLKWKGSVVIDSTGPYPFLNQKRTRDSVYVSFNVLADKVYVKVTLSSRSKTHFICVKIPATLTCTALGLPNILGMVSCATLREKTRAHTFALTNKLACVITIILWITKSNLGQQSVS